jgi:hypothetical protein
MENTTYVKYGEFAKNYDMVLCNMIAETDEYLFENIVV